MNFIPEENILEIILNVGQVLPRSSTPGLSETPWTGSVLVLKTASPWLGQGSSVTGPSVSARHPPSAPWPAVPTADCATCHLSICPLQAMQVFSPHVAQNADSAYKLPAPAHPSHSWVSRRPLPTPASLFSLSLDSYLSASKQALSSLSHPYEQTTDEEICEHPQTFPNPAFLPGCNLPLLAGARMVENVYL